MRTNNHRTAVRSGSFQGILDQAAYQSYVRCEQIEQSATEAASTAIVKTKEELKHNANIDVLVEAIKSSPRVTELRSAATPPATTTAPAAGKLSARFKNALNALYRAVLINKIEEAGLKFGTPELRAKAEKIVQKTTAKLDGYPNHWYPGYLPMLLNTILTRGPGRNSRHALVDILAEIGE